MNYRKATQKLKQLGCEEIPTKKSGSHRSWFNPSTNGKTTIPDWGSKDLKTGTLRNAIKQLGIDYKKFLDQ